eukprot:g31981.t1
MLFGGTAWARWAEWPASALQGFYDSVVLPGATEKVFVLQLATARAEKLTLLRRVEFLGPCVTRFVATAEGLIRNSRRVEFGRAGCLLDLTCGRGRMDPNEISNARFNAEWFSLHLRSTAPGRFS